MFFRSKTNEGHLRSTLAAFVAPCTNFICLYMCKLVVLISDSPIRKQFGNKKYSVILAGFL